MVSCVGPKPCRVIRTASDDGHKKSPCFQGLQFFWDLLEYRMVVEAGSKILLQAPSYIGFMDQAKTSYPDSYPLFGTLRHFVGGIISFPFVGIVPAD